MYHTAILFEKITLTWRHSTTNTYQYMDGELGQGMPWQWSQHPYYQRSLHNLLSLMLEIEL